MIQKGDTTKTTIITKAIRLASQFGIEKMTIGGLAKAAGMSKSGVFAHFRSKENLQMEVLQSVRSQFETGVLLPAFREPRGLPRLRAIFENWVTWFESQDLMPGGCVLIAASIEFDDVDGVVRELVEKTQRDLIFSLAKATQIAIDEGHFRSDVDPKQFSWSMYSFVLGYHHFKRLLKEPDAEFRLRRSFEGLLEFAQFERVSESKKKKTSKSKRRNSFL